MTDNRELDWFKSSYSDGSEGDSCVEVAATPHAVLVRDSKDTARAHLAFGRPAWEGFVAQASEV
ncbi:DUF397 domain-containing protein [Streptomyces yangpuensis]|uniref:DUF397 domain-containing protein n=1 Tax=Streptomyces yangpuensis TaxID=1648182 RepID=UPI0006294AB4|nr:DUF397 domain-containing protein [Streptomyces yangpuensis]